MTTHEEATMSKYTAEDFAQANLATRGDFGAARRTDPNLTHQWHAYGSRQGYFSDEEMAADGWVPVVEDAAQERTIRELRQDLAVARKEMADLRDENDRLELILQEPLSLKDMRIAWDAAYEEEECREGDVLVTRHSDDNYEVWVSVETFDISKKTRVLSRAPKPEPWKDLADVLGDFVIYDTDGSNVRAGEAAQFLYEHGVRMAGGGDDE